MKNKPSVILAGAIAIAGGILLAGCSHPEQNSASPAVSATNVTLTTAQRAGDPSSDRDELPVWPDH